VLVAGIRPEGQPDAHRRLSGGESRPGPAGDGRRRRPARLRSHVLRGGARGAPARRTSRSLRQDRRGAAGRVDLAGRRRRDGSARGSARCARLRLLCNARRGRDLRRGAKARRQRPAENGGSSASARVDSADSGPQRGGARSRAAAGYGHQPGRGRLHGQRSGTARGPSCLAGGELAGEARSRLAHARRAGESHRAIPTARPGVSGPTAATAPRRSRGPIGDR
jgi:hypothetical protein